MPEEFDPAWEYRDDSDSDDVLVCDLFAIAKTGNSGMRRGRGNPDRYFFDVPPYLPAESRAAKPPRRIRCAACGGVFDQPEGKVLNCSVACGVQTANSLRKEARDAVYADNIKSFRELRDSGLRVHELADLVGVSQATIVRWRRLYW